MSQVLGEEVKKVIYRKAKELVGIKCDICGKVIPVDERGFKNDECRYFVVTTGHNDWGNDSCESIKHYDICPECVGGFVAKYLANAEGSEYIEVEHEYGCKENIILNG